MKVKDFILKFEELFPLNFAYKWDNVGLQVGSKEMKISNVLVALDLTKEVIEEALCNNVNLIVVHHPMIFSPIKSISTDSYLGTLINMLMKNDINLYIAHTNFDISNHGMNKILADMLELRNQKVIEMETLEEGLGRYGDLKEELPLKVFIKKIKELFNIDTVKLITTEDDKVIKTVAIAGGSGSSLLNNPVLEQCDIYVSGDITYHHALDALNKGLTVLDVGHNVEKSALPALVEQLKQFSNEFEVYISNVDSNPYKNL